MENKDIYKNMIKCPKCGKWSKKSYIEIYGTCLCGEILDGRAKYKYEMFKKLRLWRNKNYKDSDIERGKYE